MPRSVKRRFEFRRRAALAAVLLLASAAPERAAAQTARLASGAEFTQRLQASAGVGWTAVPLRDALESLGPDLGLAVMLDRRVDPGQTLNLTLAEQPLEHVLRTIARERELGVCFVDSVVYFGPPQTTGVLPTVAAMRRHEAERLPREAAQRFARVRAWGWPLLTTPRDLLRELAREGNFQIEGLEQFPHDLWPAVQLPPLPLADRLTLVLAGFGRTYQVSADGSRLQLTPMPETAAISRTYPGKGHPRENAERIARLYPEAQVRAEGEMIHVVGPWEAHQGVEALMQGQRVSRTAEAPGRRGGRTAYTLKVESEPVGGVLKALAEQLRLKVTIEPGAEARLSERISFNVSDVSREELFRAVLQGTGLKFRLTADELQISPAE